MARIFDVVEYPREMVDEIVHRFQKLVLLICELAPRSLYVNHRQLFSFVMVVRWMCLVLDVTRLQLQTYLF